MFMLLQLFGSIIYYSTILHQHTTQFHYEGITVDSELVFSIWQNQHWSCGQIFLQKLETVLTSIRPHKCRILLSKTSYRSCNSRKILHKSPNPIVSCQTKEACNFYHYHRSGSFRYRFNFSANPLEYHHWSPHDQGMIHFQFRNHT